MPNERPILFSAPMVRAILEGRKTQTRRICKPAFDGFNWAASVHPDGAATGWIAWWPKAVEAEETAKRYPGAEGFPCPWGWIGDRLWVKETFRQASGAWGEHQRGAPLEYRADSDDMSSIPWRSPLYMPRWASRIRLEIMEIRCEQLEDISDEDAIAEGIEGNGIMYRDYSPEGTGLCTQTPRSSYCGLWDSLNGKRFPWTSNPWVWVIIFQWVNQDNNE